MLNATVSYATSAVNGLNRMICPGRMPDLLFYFSVREHIEILAGKFEEEDAQCHEKQGDHKLICRGEIAYTSFLCMTQQTEDSDIHPIDHHADNDKRIDQQNTAYAVAHRGYEQQDQRCDHADSHLKQIEPGFHGPRKSRPDTGALQQHEDLQDEIKSYRDDRTSGEP